MKYDLDKPCNECPFRRKAPAGWLGPWSVAELLLVIGRSAFACHRTIKRGGDYDLDAPGLQSCAGMAIFLNNKMERSRDHMNAHHQDLLANSPHAKDVFANSTEFADHHESRNRRPANVRSRPNRRTRR